MGMGYQGFAKFYLSGPQSNDRLLLCTGSSVNLVLEPIMSAAVWGAGWYNASQVTHYADSVIRYNGGIDFELQVGNNNEIWNFIRDWAIDWRAYPRSLQLSPDGYRVYNYLTTGTYSEGNGGPVSNFEDQEGAWVESMSFTTSEGSFVTGSITVTAIYRQEASIGDIYINQRDGVTSAATFSTIVPLNQGQLNVNPIAFWKTKADMLATATGTWVPGGGTSEIQTGLETIDWSLDLSNNPVILYTCNGDRQPTAVMMGAADTTGSVTLFHQEGVFDPSVGRVAENTCFRVQIGTDGVWPTPATSFVYLECPAVLIEGDDYGIKGQSEVTTRGMTIHGLGGRVAGGVIYPSMVMYNS